MAHFYSTIILQLTQFQNRRLLHLAINIDALKVNLGIIRRRVKLHQSKRTLFVLAPDHAFSLDDSVCVMIGQT